MKVDEKSLWSWLSKARAEWGADLHMNRIENVVGTGTPDVFGCLMGRCFTIELKAIAKPKSKYSRITIGISPEQAAWAKARIRAGGMRHWFLIQVGAKKYLVNAKWVHELVGDLTEADLAEMAVPMLDMTPKQVILEVA